MWYSIQMESLRRQKIQVGEETNDIFDTVEMITTKSKLQGL